MFRTVFHFLLFVLSLTAGSTAFAYTHADTLRGSNGRGRAWWNVKRYELTATFDTASRSISGSNEVSFTVIAPPADSMQIDLQEPMILDSVVLVSQVFPSVPAHAALAHEGNVWWVKYPFSKLKRDSVYTVVLYYHGTPRAAVNPPWDGGFSWKRDSLDHMWIAVSCQGFGASSWWPCKDAQWEEPEEGMSISLTVPAGMQAVSNGRMVSTGSGGGNTTTTWQVRNPINNYDVTFYIGDYVHWTDTIMGEKGTLDLAFYVLSYNEARAREHFAVVRQMIRCFEYWFGAYPFYEDGYKLVDAPYLGMEHQSAIAYGNGYKMGYKGIDRSMSGYGLKWDYIIIHESGHEWFGNNITAHDMADNWIHEGITSFSESLFTEWLVGKEKGQKYSRGLWRGIDNEKPLIAAYGVNDEGTGDIYEKGAAVMHMIRVMMNDDERFRQLLRGLGKEFYHGIVTTQQVEAYIMRMSGLSLQPFFNQYLRRANIPVLEYYVKDDVLHYRFDQVGPGFSLALIASADDVQAPLTVTAQWQTIPWKGGPAARFTNDYLIKVRRLEQ